MLIKVKRKGLSLYIVSSKILPLEIKVETMEEIQRESELGVVSVGSFGLSGQALEQGACWGWCLGVFKMDVALGT